MSEVSEKIVLKNALVVGSNEWHRHRNLSVKILKLSSQEFSAVRRHFNVARNIQEEDGIVDKAKDIGWSIDLSEVVQYEVSKAAGRIRVACRYSGVDWLILTEPASGKASYSKMIFEQMEHIKAAELVHVLYDVRSNNRTFVYMINH